MNTIFTEIGQMLSVMVVAMVIVMVAMAIYDKVSEKGCCEWKDIMCDLIGIVIGVL